MEQGPSAGLEAQASAHARDLDFVQRVLRREPQALAELNRRLECLPAMLRHRGRSMGVHLQPQELEELVQETVLALWIKLHTYEGRAALESWVYRFATLELLKSLQRRARAPRSAPDATQALAAVAQDVQAEPWPFDLSLVQNKLEQLEPTTARIIRARHFQNSSFEDIALAEAAPLNTVKARYYRGLERLRDQLEREQRRSEG